MPPAVSMPLGAIVFGVLYVIFGERYAPGLGAGFFAGYLAYDMIHYYVHHFRPRGPLGRMLRERHMRHHFQDDTRGFGISAPYWDEVFRTSSRGLNSPHPPRASPASVEPVPPAPPAASEPGKR
jgi:sterol desaturase/sphingolipid hydroxylase (fatty acid hydroxylase superfamily)